MREVYELLLKIAKRKEVDSWRGFLNPVKRGKHHLLVSEYGSRIIGMFSLNFLPKSGMVFIDYIVVDKNFRHKHLATKMLRKGIAKSCQDAKRQKKKVAFIATEVMPSKKKLIRFLNNFFNKEPVIIKDYFQPALLSHKKEKMWLLIYSKNAKNSTPKTDLNLIRKDIYKNIYFK